MAATDPISFRAAREEDYALYVRLFPELATSDPTPPRDRWLAQLYPATVIAEQGGSPIGFVYFQILAGVGYVRQIVVAPEVRRAGLGRALMHETAERMRTAGAQAWALNVKPDNTPAVRLYHSLGMRRQYASSALRLSWADALTLPAAPSVQAGPIAPDDDAAVESAMRLLPGTLAGDRGRDRVLLQLRDAAHAIAGVASYDPSFPGAFPFRVARPELAGVLLRAMHPHARHDFTGVVIEDDAPLVEVLCRAGAVVKLNFEHYQGPL